MNRPCAAWCSEGPPRAESPLLWRSTDPEEWRPSSESPLPPRPECPVRTPLSEVCRLVRHDLEFLRCTPCRHVSRSAFVKRRQSASTSLVMFGFHPQNNTCFGLQSTLRWLINELPIYSITNAIFSVYLFNVWFGDAGRFFDLLFWCRSMLREDAADVDGFWWSTHYVATNLPGKWEFIGCVCSAGP